MALEVPKNSKKKLLGKSIPANSACPPQSKVSVASATLCPAAPPDVNVTLSCHAKSISARALVDFGAATFVCTGCFKPCCYKWCLARPRFLSALDSELAGSHDSSSQLNFFWSTAHEIISVLAPEQRYSLNHLFNIIRVKGIAGIKLLYYISTLELV